MPCTPSQLSRFLIVLLTIASYNLWGQSFGGLAPDIRWKQINTDTVRIIFPEALTAKAQHLASAVHYLKRHAQEDIGDKTFKIDIVINNQSTIANGSVSIAPWKSHFLTTPLQDNFALTAMPWLDLLAIHEYRHVTQLSTTRRGVVNFLSYLFGQETWAGGANLSVPSWFTEGDAVWAETQFSGQGRGRISHFLQGYRTLSQEENWYSYAKARNGSIKDYVPDHYRLGYLLVDYGHDKFGPNFWKEVLIDAASFRGILYPFSKAITQRTGLNSSELYSQMLEENREGWNNSGGADNGTKVLPETPPKTFTDHLFPHLTNDSSIIYFSRTYNEIGKFYRLNLQTGQQRALLTRGIGLEPYFGFNGNLIAWTELTTDPRWTERDYSDILVYDIISKKRKRITHKQRYFSPQPNRTGSRIACVQVDGEGNSAMHILALDSGESTHTFLNQGWYYTFPQWTVDEQSLVAAVRNEQGWMSIIHVNIESGAQTLVVPFRNKILGVPAIHDREVYYSASTGNVEQIFATNLTTGTTRKVTNEMNGAFQPAPGDSGIYYTTFTPLGHVIKKIVQGSQIESEDAAFEFDVSRNFLDSFPDIKFPVEKYNQWTHSLNVHTWGLNYEDPEIIARILSNNVLNNVELSAGVSYDYNQQLYRPFAEFQVATAYPTLAFQASTSKRAAVIDDETRNWRELSLFAGAYVDYNLTSGRFTRSLIPLIGLNRTSLSGDIDTSISSVLAQLTFTQQQIRAKKNIFTHHGQYLQLRYSRAIDQFAAEQFTIRSGWAFRGIGVNHNLLLEADLKADLLDAEYQFSNGINHRGYGVLPAEKSVRLAADYHLPLVYPDWGFAGLIYFYRVRANLFYEYSRILRGSQNKQFQSVGAEVVFDVNLVNELEASFGVRYSYPIDDTTLPVVEVFVPVYRF